MLAPQVGKLQVAAAAALVRVQQAVAEVLVLLVQVVRPMVELVLLAPLPEVPGL